MDRRSRPDFAQVFYLKVHELASVEMAGSVQGKQHAFDLVRLDGVIRKPRHMLSEQIRLGLNVSDIMLRREPTYIGCGGVLGRCFRVLGHGSSSPVKYNVSCPENPLKRVSPRKKILGKALFLNG
jgi:hypothetical protein